jgi:hypothetical protein
MSALGNLHATSKMLAAACVYISCCQQLAMCLLRRLGSCVLHICELTVVLVTHSLFPLHLLAGPTCDPQRALLLSCFLA